MTLFRWMRDHYRAFSIVGGTILVVLGLLLRGQSNKLIARELDLSVETVKDHVAAVLRTLGERIASFPRPESILSLEELEERAHWFDVVNIKLDKCGGLTEGLLMAERAREMGLKVMVGNMVGTSLAMAPAFLLGQFCDIVDLDGPLFLQRDRSPGVVYFDGLVDCPASVWGSPDAVL